MPKKQPAKKRRVAATRPIEAKTPPTGGGFHALRETIESIVIAFVLAFLFRTFEAEAFVIPTGSMSPSLQGQHKDVHCSECGYRFRTTASSEGEDTSKLFARLNSSRTPPGDRSRFREQIRGLQILAGMCPMCRYTMPFRNDLPEAVKLRIGSEPIEPTTSYPGDRILVNKYSYVDKDPERWDVVVFKFPGNGEMNYIKRLVGLPGETLRIEQGDLFTRPLEESSEFQIQRKSPDKVQTMLQMVHDTDFEASVLHRAGWPLRWQPTGPEGWSLEATPGEQVVDQSFRFDGTGEQENSQPAWLRYQHLLPDENDWQIAREFRQSGTFDGSARRLGIDQQEWLDSVRPQLITDFNPYNARIRRDKFYRIGWRVEPHNLGLNWVSDLAVRCDVNVEQARGELLLQLVEAGKRFTCRIDLQTGRTTLRIDGLEDFKCQADTSVAGPGSYRLLFANVDDQLLLWVDDELIDFGDATYDADVLYSGRANALPQPGQMAGDGQADAPGSDLQPVGVGVWGAALEVTRLQVLRDIYYGAVKWTDEQKLTDYKSLRLPVELEDGTRLRALKDPRQLFTDPDQWGRFATRSSRDFDIHPDQFFVLGDNSPASQDCRLWSEPHPHTGAKPGGPYLDRKLLTGKAVCVFWPHSWGSIPGLNFLPGFPAFGDMRLVR